MSCGDRNLQRNLSPVETGDTGLNIPEHDASFYKQNEQIQTQIEGCLCRFML